MSATTTTGYRLFEITADRVEDYRAVDGMAFAEPARDPALDAEVPFAVPLDRAVAVETEDGEIVAVHGSYAVAGT